MALLYYSTPVLRAPGISVRLREAMNGHHECMNGDYEWSAASGNEWRFVSGNEWRLSSIVMFNVGA